MDSATLYKWPAEIDYIRDDPVSGGKSHDFMLSGSNIAFRLTLDPTGRDEYNKSAVFLELRDLAGGSSVNVKFRLWIEDSFGKKLLTTPVEMAHEFTEVGEQSGSRTFTSYMSIFKENTVFSKQGFAIICCEVMRIKPKNDHDLKFRDKYYEFYQQGISDNCSLQVEDKDYVVPKNYLMASSQMFERMLTTEGEESNTIKLTDVRPEIVVNFIKYLHTGKMDNLNELAEETFIFADRYEIEDIKSLCIQSLAETFSKENITHRFHLASKYESVELRNHSVFYITNYGSEGNFRHIFQTDEWNTLMKEDSKLADEISNAFFDKII
jgi:hypothetical protein